MDKSNKRRIYWLSAVIICAAIGPPVLFGAAPGKPDRKGGDPWRNMIEDFQTLLTGIFAVGAAYVTVRQMQISDQKSDVRHQELVRLGLRFDRLIVERMLYPQFGQLRECYRSLRSYELEGYDESDEAAYVEEIKRSSESFRNLAVWTRNVVYSPNWQAARHLFGGTLSHDEAILTALCNELQDHAVLIFNTLQTAETEIKRWKDGVTVPVTIDQVIIEGQRLVPRTRNAMEPVFKALYELADTYGIPG